MIYLLEIFSIYSSHICANLIKNFLLLLNQPASHGPFEPKLWMPLATIFVDIFQKEKKWWGSRPIWVTWWKEFSISFKKWCFEFFHWAKASTFTMTTSYSSSLSVKIFVQLIWHICTCSKMGGTKLMGHEWRAVKASFFHHSPPTTAATPHQLHSEDRRKKKKIKEMAS